MSALKFTHAFVITLFLSQLCVATDSNVELEDGTVLSGVATAERQLPDSALTTLGITVGVSKLSDVTNKLHGNPIFHEGDAGKSLYILCYRGTDGTILAFESSGELGGAEHKVTNIAVFSSKTRYRLAGKCAQSSRITKNIEIGGTRLGMTKDWVKKTNGNPSKEQEDLLLFSFHTQKQPPRGTADITSMLQIRFTDKMISQFSISKIESL